MQQNQHKQIKKTNYKNKQTKLRQTKHEKIFKQ